MHQPHLPREETLLLPVNRLGRKAAIVLGLLVLRYGQWLLKASGSEQVSSDDPAAPFFEARRRGIDTRPPQSRKIETVFQFVILKEI